jgi:hypothetical protein
VQHEINNKADTVLIGKPEGKRPFERSSVGWEDNIKIKLK